MKAREGYFDVNERVKKKTAIRFLTREHQLGRSDFTLFRQWIHQIPRTVRSMVAFATRHPAPIVGHAASAPAILDVAVITADAASSREVAAASVVRTAVGSRIEVRIRSHLVSPLLRPIP
jgi:hypothetical protein